MKNIISINKKIINPINDHYSSIDNTTLQKLNKPEIDYIINSSKFIQKRIKRAGIEFAMYSKSLVKGSSLRSLQGQQSYLLSTKDLKNKPGKSKNSIYSNIVNRNIMELEKDYNTNIKGKIVNWRYIKSFTGLDIISAQNQNTLYEFTSNTLNEKIFNKNIFEILKGSFISMRSIISKPHFYVSPNLITINLFYYVNSKKLKDQDFLSSNYLKLKALSSRLSNYFGKPINLELTRVFSMSHNSQIFAYIIGKLAKPRRRTFNSIIGRFYRHQTSKIPLNKSYLRHPIYTSVITGLHIKLGGRLARGKIIPRRTVKLMQYGNLSRFNSNYLTNARSTQKNKRGSFSMTVSIAHKFF